MNELQIHEVYVDGMIFKCKQCPYEFQLLSWKPFRRKWIEYGNMYAFHNYKNKTIPGLKMEMGDTDVTSNLWQDLFK